MFWRERFSGEKLKMFRGDAGIPQKLGPVFQALVEANDYALDARCSEWDFAVSIESLRTLGANDSDLRWLAKKQYVLHAREVTVEGDDGREFRRTGNLSFCEQTCFILTDAGAASFHGRTSCFRTNNAVHQTHAESHSDAMIQPIWDPYSRKLQYGGLVVKRFKWPAANQETVLCAFQEEGWPERIDDPLVPQPEQDSKRRLADTIKCLNRKQINDLICFHGDGTGEGILWERNGTDRSSKHESIG